MPDLPADYLREWWHARVGPAVGPGIEGTAKAVGGTKALAKDVGVTQRTVQRWIRGEKGMGGEVRKPNRAQAKRLDVTRAQAEDASDAGKLLAEIERRGLQVDRGAEVDYSFNQDRERYYREERIIGRDVHLEPGSTAMGELLEMLAAEEWDRAAAAFDEAFWGSNDYAAPGGQFELIHAMTLRIGG